MKPPLIDKNMKINTIMDIPPGKVLEMQEYAKMLRNKFPSMNMIRLMRKVAAEYHIKLIEHDL